MTWVIRPGLAAWVMGIVVHLLNPFLPGGRITTILCVIAGMMTFAVAAVLLKAITKNDLRAIIRRKKA